MMILRYPCHFQEKSSLYLCFNNLVPAEPHHCVYKTLFQFGQISLSKFAMYYNSRTHVFEYWDNPMAHITSHRITLHEP